jgi:hypothetical protein
MKNERIPTEAGEQYAAAHAAHYTEKNLHRALVLYKGVVNAHPNTPEAGYSHSQIQDIVKNVVPKQELLNAQVELALACTRDEHAGNGGKVTTGTRAEAQYGANMQIDLTTILNATALAFAAISVFGPALLPLAPSRPVAPWRYRSAADIRRSPPPARSAPGDRTE